MEKVNPVQKVSTVRGQEKQFFWGGGEFSGVLYIMLSTS